MLHYPFSVLVVAYRGESELTVVGCKVEHFRSLSSLDY